jgi:2-oxo-3-hexenedioate decarboxylase
MDPQEIAGQLAAAQHERRHRQPVTDEFPDLDLETAYAARWAGVQARLEAAEQLVGAKLGLTSKAKQRVMNVDAPLYGFVTDGNAGAVRGSLLTKCPVSEVR